MNVWNELVSTALLGTSRAPLPAPNTTGGSLDALLAQLPDRPPEGRLLSMAAVVHVWRQAGIQPSLAHTPRSLPAPHDTAPTCPPPAAACLAEILADLSPSAGRDSNVGQAQELLKEWLRRLIALSSPVQPILPHRYLPDLLDLAWRQEDLCPLIAPLLGQRGRWLAAQHTDWQWLILPADPQAVQVRWTTGTAAVRAILMRQVRATDPVLARELAAATWKQDPAADRARFAQTFAIGLDAADEPFLESLLDDRGQQVRATASDLLARLPGSRLARRAEERLKPLLTLERGGLLRAPRLKVILPQACTPDMARDGIVEKPSSSMGKRAWWLAQTIAAVPPGYWTDTLGLPPAQLIALAAATEHADALVAGWAHAAARHHDGDWAEAVLQHRSGCGDPLLSLVQSPDQTSDTGELVQSVPRERLETWLANLVRAGGSLEEKVILYSLIQNHRRPWGRDFTQAMLDALRPMSALTGTGVWRWRSSLPDFALYADPALAAQAEQSWSETPSWQKQIDRFFTILHFRARMAKAFMEK